MSNYPQYTKRNFADYPAKTSPLNATNLNGMDEGIYDNREAIRAIDDRTTTVEGALGSASSASSVTGSDAFSKINTLNSNLTTKGTCEYIGSSNQTSWQSITFDESLYSELIVMLKYGTAYYNTITIPMPLFIANTDGTIVYYSIYDNRTDKFIGSIRHPATGYIHAMTNTTNCQVYIYGVRK